jgi:hypothetical protein
MWRPFEITMRISVTVYLVADVSRRRYGRLSKPETTDLYFGPSASPRGSCGWLAYFRLYASRQRRAGVDDHVCPIGLLKKEATHNSAIAINRIARSVDDGHVCSNRAELLGYVPATQNTRELDVCEDDVNAGRPVAGTSAIVA